MRAINSSSVGCLPFLQRSQDAWGPHKENNTMQLKDRYSERFKIWSFPSGGHLRWGERAVVTKVHLHLISPVPSWGGTLSTVDCVLAAVRRKDAESQLGPHIWGSQCHLLIRTQNLEQVDYEGKPEKRDLRWQWLPLPYYLWLFFFFQYWQNRCHSIGTWKYYP